MNSTTKVTIGILIIVHVNINVLGMNNKVCVTNSSAIVYLLFAFFRVYSTSMQGYQVPYMVLFERL